MKIQCEVSLGELVDKLSILSIKIKKISDPKKIKLAEKEHQVLSQSLKELALQDIDLYLNRLEEVNTKLWEIEDDIRECEKGKEFSEKFITLARAVYVTNDQRFAIKNEINDKYGSSIKEVKSYEEYQFSINIASTFDLIYDTFLKNIFRGVLDGKAIS